MYRPIKNWAARDRSTCNGYTLIYVPEHPKSFNGFYYEHRLVIESHLDRILDSTETVHHIGCKSDNSWNNLFLCTWQEHERLNRQEHLLTRQQ
jgi:hypothetical protein